MNTKEIELLLKKYTTPIHDDMGFTGDYKTNVKDIVDMFLNERDVVLSLLSVSKSFCQCEKPIYNYPEMVWCDNCTKEIKD